jgi:hypothetical protein
MIRVNNTFINPHFIITVDLEWRIRDNQRTGEVRLIFSVSRGQEVEVDRTDYFPSEAAAMSWYRKQLALNQFSLSDAA